MREFGSGVSYKPRTRDRIAARASSNRSVDKSLKHVCKWGVV
jgi:hypothetical protein